MESKTSAKDKKMASFVGSLQMQLASFQKSHCCMIFESPDSMTDAMEVFFSDLENHIGFLSEYIQHSVSVDGCVPSRAVDERILELINSPYHGKKPSKKIRLCRAQIFLSVAYLCSSFRALDNDDVKDAIIKLGRGELFFGQYMGSAGATFSEDAIEVIARKGAESKHAPHRAAREFVTREWVQHRAAYDGNKSAFSRDYVKRVLNEMKTKVTEKQMREVWLKDTPSAGIPSGLPADG